MATVTRTARQGRKADPTTVASLAMLDKRWAAKAREDLPIIGPDGTVTDTLKAVIVTAEDFGKPATWTGLRPFVSKWAKDNGHAVSCLKCDGNEFAIVAKG